LGAGAANLKIIGDGPMTDDVAQAVVRLGVADDVELDGRQPHEKVQAAFRDADIYVQHSVTAPDGDEEGLPVSITEALAAGLPVIATRHSGIPEVVREGETGYLVDEHDAAGMGRRMAALARNRPAWARLGGAGQALLRAEFAVPVVQAQLRALLEETAAAPIETLGA
jgi:glycosyltransferase involved in cell wall biosynthesis